jgi:type IV secretion system protein VirB5
VKKFSTTVAVCLVLMCGPTGAAYATMPVIDVAAITQLLQEIMAWDEQLQGMRAQLSQLQQTTSALTGPRGMEQLLPQTPAARNYLPADWISLANVVESPGGADPTLSRAARAQRDANAILQNTALSRLSPSLQSMLLGERDAVAVSQVATRTAYARSSDRFASLSTLISQIRAAPDAKAIAELQSRIEAEQAMLANEHIKLLALAQATDAERGARDLARREAALQNHGAFGGRFQPVPPVP